MPGDHRIHFGTIGSIWDHRMHFGMRRAAFSSAFVAHASGPTDHTFNGFWDLKPQILGAWTVWVLFADGAAGLPGDDLPGSRVHGRPPMQGT